MFRSLENFDIEKDILFLRQMNSYFNGCEEKKPKEFLFLFIREKHLKAHVNI